VIPTERALWDYAFARQGWFGPYPVRDGTPTLSLASAAAGAGPTAMLAWPTLATPRAGALAPVFGGDFYERLHFSSTLLALGNVVGVQERAVAVWNAQRRARRLTAIDFANAAGVLISAGSVPADLPALSDSTWTVRVTQDGPPVIAATLTWQFDGPQSVPVLVTGNRVTAWVWLADWSQPVVERLEWLTDVLTAHNGDERRRSLRAAPRRSAEFGYVAEGDARRQLELLLHGWGARVWARPVWEAVTRLPAAASAGATTLAADTTGGGFAAGGLAMLHDGATRAELVEVSAVAAASLTLLRPTAGAWPAGTRLYPAHAARLAEAAQLRHESSALSVGRARFDDEAPATLSTAHGLATYRGVPVLALRHDWDEAPEIALDRKLARLDNLTGRPLVEDESGRPAPRQSRLYTLASRAEAETWRRVLAALRGRHGALWLDSATDDLRIVAPVAAAAVTLDVRWCGYTLYAQGHVGRRDLRIATTAGVFMHRVVSSVELTADVERLTIDAALGVDLALAQIERVSWLHPVRLDADAAEIAWETDTVARSRVAWRSVPDVL
jgi:hypothetical protein